MSAGFSFFFYDQNNRPHIYIYLFQIYFRRCPLLNYFHTKLNFKTNVTLKLKNTIIHVWYRSFGEISHKIKMFYWFKISIQNELVLQWCGYFYAWFSHFLEREWLEYWWIMQIENKKSIVLHTIKGHLRTFSTIHDFKNDGVF